MKKLFVFMFVLIIGLGVVSSIDLDSFDLENLGCEMILLNEGSIVGFKIPDEVPFTNENFNIYISDEFFMNIILKEKTFDDLDCLENEAATYDILIKDYSVFERFVKSDDMLTTFLEAKKSKDIQIVGKSFGKKTKMFFVNIGVKIFSWFN